MKPHCIETRDDKVQLYIVTPLYKNLPNCPSQGDINVAPQQVFDKNISVRKWMNKDAITSVDEYINDNNTISKTKSIIYDKYSAKFFITNHSVDDVMDNISRSVKKIGFLSITAIVYLTDFIELLEFVA